MELFNASDKTFDYLIDHARKVDLHEIEAMLAGCKIMGAELGAETLDDEKTVESIFLYLERQDGSKFMLNCSAFVWDEKYKVYDPPATLVIDKAEFPKEVM